MSPSAASGLLLTSECTMDAAQIDEGAIKIEGVSIRGKEKTKTLLLIDSDSAKVLLRKFFIRGNKEVA